MTHSLKRGPKFPPIRSGNQINFNTISNQTDNNNNNQQETASDEDAIDEKNNEEEVMGIEEDGDEKDNESNYWNEEDEEIQEEKEEDDCFNSNNNIFYTNEDNKEQIKKFIQKAQNIDSNLSKRSNDDDSNILFENKSDSTCTVSEFARKFNNISATHGFSKAAMLDILNLFDQCTCNLNLPLKNKRNIGVPAKSNHDFHFNDDGDDGDDDETENIDDDNLKEDAAAQKNLDVDKYISEDTSKFEFHVCPKGCVVYIGLYAEKINCPICHTMRFSKCKHKGCQNKQYEECNPFDIEGGHSIKYRFPLKSIYYRSSIILLAEKLLTAQKNNLDYLDYLERRINNNDIDDSNYIVDTADSGPVRNNYRIMKNRFEQIYDILLQNNIKKKIEMKNFILSGFFDGDTFFDRKSDSGWMYLVGIQNCNPSDRMSLGKGLYLTLLHLEKSGGNVERFFMKNIMAGELKKLEEGVIIQ
jgi:hypothetical protein